MRAELWRAGHGDVTCVVGSDAVPDSTGSVVEILLAQDLSAVHL